MIAAPIMIFSINHNAVAVGLLFSFSINDAGEVILPIVRKIKTPVITPALICKISLLLITINLKISD